MLYMFIFIYMLLLPFTYITLLWKILDKVEKNITENKTTTQKASRLHPTIEKSNYDNAFGGRKAYEIYKNSDGLYEPITPSKGIKLKKREE